MPVRVDRTDNIQRALANVYLRVYAEIKKDENYPARTTFLRERYNRKVYDATRKAISEVFMEGHKYVGRVLRVETYQSDSDTVLIKQESDKAVSMFWTRVDADAGRERTIDATNQRLIVTEQKESFDTVFYLTNTAMIATTGALAISTLTKARQMINDPQLGLRQTKLVGAAEGDLKLKWVAMQDEKTCFRLPNGGIGCAFLDGTLYEVDDPDIPVPGRLGPNGTHPNCRCYLSLE